MSRKTRGKASAAVVQAAREARHSPTPAEKKLWEALRGRHLASLKFRRQHPYERFILDAFCVEHQLEIEVDGGIHTIQEQATYDAERTEYLVGRGIRVLRFCNDEVMNDLENVLARIIDATRS